MNKKPRIGSAIFYCLVIFALMFAIRALVEERDGITLTSSEVVALFEDQNVKSVTVKDQKMTLCLREPYRDTKEIVYKMPSNDAYNARIDALIAEQQENGTLEYYDYKPDSVTPWYLRMIPYLLMGGILLVMMYVLLRRSSGGSVIAKFSRANARSGSEGRRVTFADVAGAEEEKEELREIVDFLRDPQKYTRMGAKIPKGVLLVGPPGTGKTLIARAVAGESQVQFFSISGSDFVELYVGVGASRVRDLFEQAKKCAPSIVFIDEIDAVGRRRGAGMGGGHDEREQTLNQLLVEMDGFMGNEGVIVMAATNRADILDPALLRPGRFDRQVYVGAPDQQGREAILKVHARNKPLAEDVDLKIIARATGGFTGADLENLLNEGALLAARANQPAIALANLEDAILKVLAGPEKKSAVVSEHARRLTAVHEAGHAVAAYYLPTHDPVQQITITPRGKAGGLTVFLPEQEKEFVSRNEMYENIIVGLGGRVAEQLFLDDISTGASQDLQQVTSIARAMVARFGMSEKLGSVVYDSDGEVFIGRDYEKVKSYSERIAGDIDEEVRHVIDTAYAKCTQLLKENHDKIEKIVAFLLQNQRMSRAQFEACMRDETIRTEANDGLFDGFAEKSES